MDLDADLIRRGTIAWSIALNDVLRRSDVPAYVTRWLPSLLGLVEFTVLVTVLGLAVARLDRWWCARSRWSVAEWLATAVMAAGGLYALRLLHWIYTHPSRLDTPHFGVKTVTLTQLHSRWDYVVLVILGGLALHRTPLRARIWALSALSVVLVGQQIGVAQLVMLLVGCLLGFAATRWGPTRQPGASVLVQGILMGGVLVGLFWRRASDYWGVVFGYTVYSFAVLRHVSFVVESWRGVPSSLADYLCYLLFFPNCVGAVEVYDEFHARNLERPRSAEFTRATALIVAGNALVWLAVEMPVNEAHVVSSGGFASMWGNLLLLFVRAVSGTVGSWSMIEGEALCLGMRLRPNFRDVVKATNPSQFWRGWRATMTNWFIRYVYVPLGGNRRHQTANLFAVFVLSTIWHCLGIPFLRPANWRPYEMAPFVAWGAINFVAVAAHARVRRHVAKARPAARPPIVAAKWALTMLFGSLTVLLLGFPRSHLPAFGRVVRTLVGLEGW